MAVRVAKEYGLDISEQRPKDVAQLAGQSFDFVITVCDRARESCPVMPGAEMIHWTFADPAEAAGEVNQLRAFRDVLQGLRRRIDLFVTVNGARK